MKKGISLARQSQGRNFVLTNGGTASSLDELLVETTSRLVRFLNTPDELTRNEISLTVGQARVLRRLVERPLSMTDVARIVGVSPQAATEMIDRLVVRRLVSRFEDPLNRRIIRVKLTARGSRIQDDVHHAIVAKMCTLTRRLSEERRHQLHTCLKELRDAFEANELLRQHNSG